MGKPGEKARSKIVEVKKEAIKRNTGERGTEHVSNASKLRADIRNPY